MDEVYEFLVTKSGIKYKETVILGISGGPDSMALLHLFLKLKKEMDLDLVCAHINHNVRKESDEEEEFVKSYCHKNGVIFESFKIQKYGDDNFENEARHMRYTFFEKIINKYGAKYLITAHHGDDLMETILMRIARGSTLKGYSGFSKMITKKNYKIIRPFITKTKQELLDYVKKNKIDYRIDKTNFDDSHTRNRYRKVVLPFFKKEDENVHLKFLKYSQTLLEYYNYVENLTKEQEKRIVNYRTIDLEKFNKLDHLLQTKIIYNLLESIYGDDLFFISDAHTDLLFNLIKSSKVNSWVHLPNNIIAVKSYNKLSFREQKEEQEEYEIQLDGIVNLPNAMNIEIIKNSNITSNFCTRLSTKDVVLPLYVRSRKNGDKIIIKNMLGSKKIKDIFIDSKISADKRKLWPIVCDATGRIVWLPGLKKSKFDKAKNEVYDIILKYY